MNRIGHFAQCEDRASRTDVREATPNNQSHRSRKQRRCAPSNPAFKSSPCGQGRRASPARRTRQLASELSRAAQG